MTALSPWARDTRVRLVFGEELPLLLRHHRHKDQPVHRRFWPVGNDPAQPKPTGGMWTAPAVLPRGKWRPIPRRSAWTDWCASEWPAYINTLRPWITEIRARPDAAFAVIDSAADAVALYETFPNDSHPVTELMRESGLPTAGGLFGRMIDWSRLMDVPIAGVYLTDRGQMETRLPDEDFVPSLYGWDAASVWFSRGDVFTVGRTWRARPLDPDPYGMGSYDDVDLGEAAAELRDMNARFRKALDAADARDLAALKEAVAELRAQPDADEPGSMAADAIETFEEFIAELEREEGEDS